jgi:hypothetical protein
MITKEIPVNDEQLLDTLFEIGDIVDVIANKDDIFNDFFGRVIGYKEEGIVQVKDQDDNVWDVGENQCAKA